PEAGTGQRHGAAATLLRACRACGADQALQRPRAVRARSAQNSILQEQTPRAVHESLCRPVDVPEARVAIQQEYSVRRMIERLCEAVAQLFRFRQPASKLEGT